MIFCKVSPESPFWKPKGKKPIRNCIFYSTSLQTVELGFPIIKSTEGYEKKKKF